MNLVFLLEELSMKIFLEELLPRVLPDGVCFQLIPHEGKSDLDASIPRKLRAWRTPETYFVVVRDQDSADCHTLKSRLAGLCNDAGRPDTLVRIACRELESWLLGDLEAVGTAFEAPKLSALQTKAKFRDPDRLGSPNSEIEKLVPNYQKVGGARAIARHFSAARCRSYSFQMFLSGVRALAASER